MANLPNVRDFEKFELDESSRQVFKDILESYDKDKTGNLNREQLEDCLCCMGFHYCCQDLKNLEDYFDRNGDNQICIDEVLDNIHILNAVNINWKDIREAFKVFDRNNDGSISFKELIKILTMKGQDQMSVERARKIATYLQKNYDKNMDGKFSYSEFVDFYLDKDAILNLLPEPKKKSCIQTSLD